MTIKLVLIDQKGFGPQGVILGPISSWNVSISEKDFETKLTADPYLTVAFPTEPIIPTYDQCLIDLLQLKLSLMTHFSPYDPSITHIFHIYF